MIYKICFYVPEKELDQVKTALFEAGAGRYPHYEHCCWQTPGLGQFRPLAGSQPHLGTQGKLHQHAEYKVEMICREEHLKDAILALKAKHPYEEPAYDIIKLEDVTID